MKKILVVGDSMLDVAIHGTSTRMSQEAPIPIFDRGDEDHFAGGAANVALNAHAMGGEVMLLSSCGYVDSASEVLRQRLKSLNAHWIAANSVTIKTRMFVDRRIVFRMDEDYVLSDEYGQQMLSRFKVMAPQYDVIVFSDYGKGALQYVSTMIELCQQSGKTSIVDPKGSDWKKYRGATIIKANHLEMSAISSDPPRILKELDLSHIIVTHGKDETFHYSNRVPFSSVPPPRTAAVDPTGAGDSFLAALAVEIANKTSVHSAIYTANRAGSAAVQHTGTYVVSKEDINV